MKRIKSYTQFINESVEDSSNYSLDQIPDGEYPGSIKGNQVYMDGIDSGFTATSGLRNMNPIWCLVIVKNGEARAYFDQGILFSSKETEDKWRSEFGSLGEDPDFTLKMNLRLQTNEEAVPLDDILKPTTQQGLITAAKHRRTGKELKLVLYDFDDKKVLASAQLRKWSPKNDFWQVAMTAAEKNYGPDLYDLAMMAVYPESLRPSTTVKPAALKVWKFYDEKRSDVKKIRIKEEDTEHEDAYETDTHSGPLDDAENLNLVNTKFALEPDDNYKKLVARGDEYMEKYGIEKSKILSKAKSYFWKKYD